MNYAELFARRPVGWHCEPSGTFFLEVFNPTPPVPDHGWKVRINNPCLKSFPHVLRVASEICYRDGIAMKCAASADALRQLHAKNIDFEIAGKALTLYPGDDENALIRLIEKLTQSLSRLSLSPANAPWSDRRIGANLSYRYGSYLPQAQIRTPAGDFTDRRDMYVLPPGISEPFPSSTRSVPEVPKSVRFHDYDISSVLHRNWGGSVYTGQALRNANQAILIKEARPDARIACDVVHTATRLLENEYRVLRTLAKEKAAIAPVPIDWLHRDRHLFLILPRIPGETLFDWRRHAAVDPSRCDTVMRHIAKKVCLLHETNTAHLDISLSNTIIGPDDTVSLIDFESARLNAETEAFAEDARLFAEVLRALLPERYRDTLQLAEQGGLMPDILDHLTGFH